MDRIGGWWEKSRHRCPQGIGQSRWGNGLPLTKTVKNGKGQLSGGRSRILAAGYSVTDAQGVGPAEATFPTLSGTQVDPPVRCTSDGHGRSRPPRMLTPCITAGKLLRAGTQSRQPVSGEYQSIWESW